MAEEFEIEIRPDGKVQVRTKGIKGPRCLEYAELFAEIIGHEESRQLTAEYHEQETEVREQTHLRQHRR